MDRFLKRANSLTSPIFSLGFKSTGPAVENKPHIQPKNITGAESSSFLVLNNKAVFDSH